MAKKKNYLDNKDLKEEILKCINDGFNKAVELGFTTNLPNYEDENSDYDENDAKTLKIGYAFNSEDPELIDKYNLAIKNGYVPERSYWIRTIREFEKTDLDRLIKSGKITKEDADIYLHQMSKPVASNKLGRMFQLIVENVSRSFYWADPDDGLDCKANALLDLCSGFWKYEPTDVNGKPFNAFAFCSQIAYFGIAGAHRILHPKKYDGTISLSCIDDNGKSFDLYNI